MTTRPSHPLVTDIALRRRLTALARRWLGQGHDAEDLVQETYLRTAIDPLPPSDAGRQAWLITVLRHLCIDLLRRQGRYEDLSTREIVQEQPSEASPEHLAEQNQQVEAALSHLTAHLAPEDAAAVLLLEVFGMGHAELSALVGRNEAASRQHLHRALQRLRSTPVGPRRAIDDASDEDAAALLAQCRIALAQRDPTGLVALLRVTRPASLFYGADMLAPTAATPEECVTSSQLVQVHGQLALAVCLGGQFLCLMPLGCLGSDMDSPEPLQYARANAHA